MKVISANASATIGICTELDLSDKDCLGVFRPSYLLEWAKLISETYGDTPVHIFRHDSSAVKAHALAASDDGDEPYIVVTSLSEV